MRNLGLEEKKILKSCTSEHPYFQKKNQYFRTIGPSMAPLELLSKRQAVVFKAQCACIGFPAIYIGLEPILEKKQIHVQFYGKASREGSLGRLLERAPWIGSSRGLLGKAPREGSLERLLGAVLCVQGAVLCVQGAVLFGRGGSPGGIQ